MRALPVLAAFVLATAALPALAAPLLSGAPISTSCDPHAEICIGKPCGVTSGLTTMDNDQKNLIACLKDDSGNLNWKSMSPFQIAPNGNLGIGTANPGATLDVGYVPDTGWGTGTVRSGKFIAYSWDATYDSVDPLTGRNYHLIGTYHGWDPNSIYIGGYNAGNTGVDADGNHYANATSVTFGGYGSGLTGWPYNTPTMTVDLINRNVGIGTTAPAGTMEVQTPTWNTNVQAGAFLNPINGNTAGVQISSGTTGGFGGHLYFVRQPTNKGWHINIDPSDGFNVSETGVLDYRLKIAPGGNVGIGTSSPVTSLDVKGSVKVGTDDSTVCSATTEGALRFNTVTKTFEGCDGTSWRGLAYH
ncbi:MAG: hypothetical protein PHY92_00725 [Alphaproteobacteria bacterium]|nr:hypothetical protein [Alphaproteobacteria bacterium]